MCCQFIKGPRKRAVLMSAGFCHEDWHIIASDLPVLPAGGKLKDDKHKTAPSGRENVEIVIEEEESQHLAQCKKASFL